jgi:tetratricopeptide (TPR) repeat protein
MIAQTRLIVLGVLCLLVMGAAPAQAKLYFGTKDYLTHIQDVDVKGPGGESLYLAYKYSFHSFLLPAYVTQDGYVLGIKGREAYFKLDDAQIKTLQTRGQLPSPLPPFQLSLIDYAMGYSLWGAALVLFGSIPLTMLGKRRRKRALPHFEEAVNHHRNGDLDRAIEGYTEAIKIDPKLALALDLRGNAFEAKGETGKAVADYTKAIAADPKLVKALVDRGNLMRTQGHNDAALSDFDKVVKLTKDAGAYVERGVTYLYKDDIDRAIKDFTAAIKAAPDYAQAYQYRSAAYVKKGETALAQADQDKANMIAGSTGAFEQRPAHAS